ncbi:MAG TPA: aminoglycoside phosphotransferase family protein [Umezawaea sp.]|nr:aminoglycoside phosphotransferase family protein [Umezawaea sp.]
MTLRESTPPADLTTVLHAACVRTGLDPAGARLIHHYANAVFLLPKENAVARITGARHADTARTGLAITRWLTDVASYPATAPLPDLEPIDIHNTTVTFWTYYAQHGRPRPDSTYLGAVVRQLHDLPNPPVELPRWRPLHSLHTAVADPAESRALSGQERSWLLARIEEVQGDLAGLDYPLGWGPIHADAWAGNLLWDDAAPVPRVVLGDWDSVCWGPREVDLIPSWHAAVRYDKGPQWARAYADSYGYDLAAWRGFDTLFAMRDLVQIAGPLRQAPHNQTFDRALRQRVAGVHAGDRNPWVEF